MNVCLKMYETKQKIVKIQLPQLGGASYQTPQQSQTEQKIVYKV